jgi:hypothetical protein
MNIRRQQAGMRGGFTNDKRLTKYGKQRNRQWVAGESMRLLSTGWFFN